MVFSSGCSLFYHKPELKMSKVDIVDFNEKAIALNLTFDVKNPNFYDIKIDGVECAFQVNESSVLNQTIQKEFTIAKKSESKIKIPLQIASQDLVGAVFDILLKKKLNYTLSGGILSNGYKIPFVSQGELSSAKIK